MLGGGKHSLLSSQALANVLVFFRPRQDHSLETLKAMSACGILLSGSLLQLVGYVPDQAQDPRTMWWLVLMVGPLQSVVHFVGLLMFRRFRFEAADVARVQAELRARRARSSGMRPC